MRNLTWIVAFALLAAASPRLAASDFTFEVPVEVHNLPPEVVTLSVFCELRRDAGPTTGDEWGKVVPLTRGSYVGTVTVSFDLPSVRRAEVLRANNYICRLRFMNGSWTGPAAPGAVLSVSGPLPPLR